MGERTRYAIATGHDFLATSDRVQAQSLAAKSAGEFGKVYNTYYVVCGDNE